MRTGVATLVEMSDGSLIIGPPKSAAGLRTVTIPDAVREDILAHLRDFFPDDLDALVFTGAKGAPLRRSNFQRTVNWTKSVAGVGLSGFRFHDLRHTGNTLAAHSGVTLADLMALWGHGSTRAALIYQHAAREQDERIADSLSDRVAAERDRARSGHAERED